MKSNLSDADAEYILNDLFKTKKTISLKKISQAKEKQPEVFASKIQPEKRSSSPALTQKANPSSTC